MDGKLALILFLSTLIFCEARYLRPIPIDFPGERPIGLLDAVEGDSLVRISDEESRKTVILDKTMKTCFITDYDPEWSLEVEERQDYVDTKEADVLKTSEDLLIFTEKVGDAISTLCRKENLIWLTFDEMQPVPQQRVPPMQGNPNLPVPKDKFAPPRPQTPRPQTPRPQTPPRQPHHRFDDENGRKPPVPQRIPTKRPEMQKEQEIPFPVPTRRAEIQKENEVPFPVPTRRPEYQGLKKQPPKSIEKEPESNMEQHAFRIPTKKPEFQNKQPMIPEPMAQGVPMMKPHVEQKSPESLKRKGSVILLPPRLPQGIPSLKKDLEKASVPKNAAPRSQKLLAPPKIPQYAPSLKKDLK